MNLTKTSITRATAQLKEMDLISEQKSGKEISVKRKYSRSESYDKAKAYLINPIQKIVTSVKEEKTIELLNAGETALSVFAELNPPRLEERAVYKGDEITDQLVIADTRYEEWDKCLRIQLWKYNPSYLAINGCVDPVSLACTFIGNEDERIEIGIEKLLEELRLLQIVDANTKVESIGIVKESIRKYIEEINALDESEVRLLQMGLPFDRDQGVELFKDIYL